MNAYGSARSLQPGAPQGEKSRLLPFNRKLRHLQGISIRNLNLSSSPLRVRGKTFDDEAVPHTLKTPAKLLAVSEGNSLSHSRSFSDLSTQGKSKTSPETPRRSPDATRRSFGSSHSRPKPILQRANTSPKQRRDNLHEAVSRRMADVFFSVHCNAAKDPVYISEVVENCMNPDFRAFDLNTSGVTITRQEHMILKLWAKPRSSREWLLLIELSLSLRSLQYIGKTLEAFHHPLPDNCVLFYLSDGIYTSFTDMPVDENPSPVAMIQPDRLPVHIEPTSSYDALMRLSTLDECIQDAIITRRRLASQISKLIHEDKVRYRFESEIVGARDSLGSVKRAVASERKQVRLTLGKVNDLKQSIITRQNAMQSGRRAEEKTREHLRDNSEKLKESQQVHKLTIDEVAGQRRRICEDLLQIYPINPIPNRSLAFTIRHLPLPNSTFQEVKEDVAAAALGHVAHLVSLLSFYLSTPLPYRLHPSSSTSSITDPISLMSSSGRTFPLFIRGSIFYRFEYGVFLLNKDIELLASRLGLKILDIRQTLPNLKYVLFVATAGVGEMPARQAGGVRGLLFRDREKDSTMGLSKPSTAGSSDAASVVGTLRSIAALRAGG